MSDHHLFDALERQARQASEGLEATGKLPAGFTAKHYPLTASERREGRRLMTALQLATDADTYVALVKEQRVPRGWLQQRLKALGVRR